MKLKTERFFLDLVYAQRVISLCGFIMRARLSLVSAGGKRVYPAAKFQNQFNPGY